MSWHLPGVPAVNSTEGTATNPDTTTILALVSSTGVSSAAGLFSSRVPRVQATVFAYLGASTLAEWWLEHCLSTGLGSTAVIDRTVLYTASRQTSQFVKKYDLVRGEFVRVRLGAALTADASAKLQAEPIA